MKENENIFTLNEHRAEQQDDERVIVVQAIRSECIVMILCV